MHSSFQAFTKGLAKEVTLNELDHQNQSILKGNQKGRVIILLREK